MKKISDADRQTDYRRYNFIRIWGKRYAHMKARENGHSTHESSARGKGIMSRRQFFAWCKQRKNFIEFLNIYLEWAYEGFPEHLTPTIDRKDIEKGYVRGNIQWMSMQDNLKKKNESDYSFGKRHHVEFPALEGAKV